MKISRRKKAVLAKTTGVGQVDTELQAGSARSAAGTTLNYRAVTTLDPRRLARAFMAADQGHITEQSALFEMIEEGDTHVFSELSKRRRAVTGLGWQLTQPKDASQSELNRTVELQDMVRGIPRFEDAHYDLTDAIGKGFTSLEIEWRTGSTWTPAALHFVPQRQFQINTKTGALMLLKSTGQAEALREWCWVVHEHRAKSGYLEQAALFRVLAWAYAYKSFNTQDMQRFLEVYGLPLRLGKYPDGIGDKAKAELLKAVRRIGHDGAGIVAKSMQIDFVQAQKTGEVADFLSAIGYWERKQSIAILGGTLTSQADGKSSTNALGEVHEKGRREIMLHDVKQLAPTISQQLVRPMALINRMFAEGRIPQFTYLTEETVDQSKMADVLTKAVRLGLEIDVDEGHKLLQLPRAKEGSKLLTLGAGPAPGGDVPKGDAEMTRRMALLRAALAADGGAADVRSAYTAQLAALTAPREAALVQQIAAIVAETGNFDEAIERIEALKAAHPVPDKDWSEAIALGLAAAHLAGRSDVADEGGKAA